VIMNIKKENKNKLIISYSHLKISKDLYLMVLEDIMDQYK